MKRKARRVRLKGRAFILLLAVSAAAICSLSFALKSPEKPVAVIEAPVITETPLPTTKPTALPTETPEPITEISPEPTEEPEDDRFIVYDIALSEELQRFTYDQCEELGLSYELVLSIMFKESSYRPEVVNNHQCYGLMQIHKVNHPALEEALGITDFLDAEQNIMGGTYLLAQIAEKYSDVHEILMVYNCGEGGAKKLWGQGVTSTAYSRSVIEYMESLEVAE